VVPWAKLEGKQLEQPASEATWNRRISKEERRRSQRAEKLKQLGYEYEAPKIKALEDIVRIEALPAPEAEETALAAVETGNTTEKASEEPGGIAEPAAEEKAMAKSKPDKGKKKAKRTAT
jgi:nucleolar protein 15